MANKVFVVGVGITKFMHELRGPRCSATQGASTWRSSEPKRNTAGMDICRISDRKAFIDTRVATIYGGTNEIMKEIIGRGLGTEADPDTHE